MIETEELRHLVQLTKNFDNMFNRFERGGEFIEWTDNGLIFRVYKRKIFIVRSEFTKGLIKYIWMKDGIPHRDGKPAHVFYSSLSDPPQKIIGYFQNGKLHRIDGPAQFSNSRMSNLHNFKHYYLDGIKYEKDEFEIQVRKIKIKKILE